MKEKNDRVFQLSLTEIAFIISFLLLLLLGYVVSKEQASRAAVEAALLNIQRTGDVVNSLNEAKEQFVAELSKSKHPNPEEVISKLLAVEEVRAERNQLRAKVADLDEKLSALTEIQAQIEAVSEKKDAGRGFVESALLLQKQALDMLKATGEQTATSSAEDLNSKLSEAIRQAIVTRAELKQQLKEHLSQDLPIGKEAQVIDELIQAAIVATDGGKGIASIKAENSDLRGQVAFLKKRLDARGGRDYPPCWADENGRIEFLFSIELRPDEVAASPAWPARRDNAAHEMPGVGEMLSSVHSYREFEKRIQPIFKWSASQDPECRHYVQLRSSITDAVQSDRARLMVENYFYKVESRR